MSENKNYTANSTSQDVIEQYSSVSTDSDSSTIDAPGNQTTSRDIDYGTAKPKRIKIKAKLIND